MSKSVYTYASISVSPYEIKEILELKITKELNEHAKLLLTGIISEDKIDKYVEESSDTDRITVALKDGEDTTNLFKGVVSSIAVEASGNVRTICIEALSETSLMDISKNSRSFQNKDATYSSIFKKLTSNYSKSDVLDLASKGEKIGALLVQYNETDWQFIKRLASHFNAPLVPASGHDGLRYYIGIPDLPKKYNLDEFNYTIKKDLRNYKLKAENDIPDINLQDLISYNVTTNEVMELCSSVTFKNIRLYVYKAVIEMKDGVLFNEYILRDTKGLSRHKIFNNALSGASLFGKVLDISKDKVKMHLEIDDGQDSEDIMWFEYSTIYSSSDGSGWYCMPEKDDKVRLYFPDAEEKNAFSASSVNLESSAPDKRSDPAVKNISTKYGKQLIFKPGAIEIIAGGQLLMRLTDDGGIEINSDKKIIMNAQEDIEINGNSKIMIQGEGGIDLKQANTCLNILDDVTLNGGKVNIQ